MKTFKTLIKTKKIFLVGEISGNHLNDFKTIKKIILKAKKSGFDAIKIQSFTAESMTFDIDKKRKSKVKLKNLIHDLIFPPLLMYFVYSQAIIIK